MGNRLIAIESPSPYLAVTWQVNNYCNFKCSYCNPGNWSGSAKNDGNLPLYISNLSTIITTYQNLGYVNFKFFKATFERTENQARRAGVRQILPDTIKDLANAPTTGSFAGR